MAISTKIRLNVQAMPGTLTDTEVASTASIQESKLLFNTSTGHHHDGTDSRKITLGSSYFVYNETPTGTINGTNSVFTLANTPAVAVIMEYNGVYLSPGTAADYVLSANTVTLNSWAPTGTDTLRAAFYNY
jgi:hypothetical protein